MPSLLEVRYRRWLRWYPPGYRATREDELVTVLLDRAEPSQQRPRPAEALDLIRGGLGARWRVGTRSPSGQAWREAMALLSVALPVQLALRGVAYLVVVARYLVSWNDPSGLHQYVPWAVYATQTLPGWPTAMAWVIVVAALVARRATLAGLAALVAVMVEATTITSYVRAGQAYRAEVLVPWLAVSVVAVILLARPSRVTRGLKLVSWQQLAIVTLGLAAADATRLWLNAQVGGPSYLSAALGVVAITVAAVSWRTPVARRALIATVSLGLMLGVGRAAHGILNQRHTTGADLAFELLAAPAVPVVVVVAAHVATSLVHTDMVETGGGYA